MVRVDERPARGYAMSPVPTATREQGDRRPGPVLPYPSIDVLRQLAKEIVVDWQLPADMERKG